VTWLARLTGDATTVGSALGAAAEWWIDYLQAARPPAEGLAADERDAWVVALRFSPPRPSATVWHWRASKAIAGATLEEIEQAADAMRDAMSTTWAARG
jgi:hypothetical protein